MAKRNGKTGAHTHTKEALWNRNETNNNTTTAEKLWEKLEQLKWHTIEFNSFMHCINYQLIIIIVGWHGLFFSVSLPQFSSLSCFWRLCSFVYCKFVPVSLSLCLTQSERVFLLIFFVFISFISFIRHVFYPHWCYIHLYLFFMHSYLKLYCVSVWVCTVVWFNAMIRYVNTRFKKTLANFRWICQLLESDMYKTQARTHTHSDIYSET